MLFFRHFLRGTSFLALCGIALAFAGSFSVAHAADCDLNAPLLNLETIKNDTTLSDRARLIQELDIRKQALKEIVRCATKDAMSLKDGLTNATTSDSVATHLQNQFLNQINDSLNYYDLKKNMIDNLGLQGTKNFANDLGIWRKDSELPLETQIFAFLLWSENRPLIAAAQTRLVQITHAMVILDLSNNQEITHGLLDAKNKLGAAIDLDGQIGTLIGSNNIPGAISHITDSLNALKNVYQDFFSLGEAVQRAFTPK